MHNTRSDNLRKLRQHITLRQWRKLRREGVKYGNSCPRGNFVIGYPQPTIYGNLRWFYTTRDTQVLRKEKNGWITIPGSIQQFPIDEIIESFGTQS